MQKKILTIKSNERVADGIYEMKLEGDGLNMIAGQFVEIALDGFFLRRPISVCDCDEQSLTLVYKVVGQGTKDMSKSNVGRQLDVLTHLGNGFGIIGANKPLLIGGGIGCAPLYKLAKKFNKMGIRPSIVLGFRNADEIYYKDKFAALGDLYIATDDGSEGTKGNAVSLLKKMCIKNELSFDRYFACGPAVMLKALQSFSANGQLSMEARMGCGFGACMGCSIVTTNGFKRVCKEGPVFEAEEVIFN